MKQSLIFSAIFLASSLMVSSCKKGSTSSTPTPTATTADSVSATAVVYEATGSYTQVNSSTSESKLINPKNVKVFYKDVSYWANTYYTYITFYNTNSTGASECISFVFLGKELPKTGTYKVGPWVIAKDGVSDDDKLLSNEVAVLTLANSWVSKRDAVKIVKVINDNGKLSISTSDEIEVFDNMYGDSKGKCKDISFTKTTTKI